MESTNKKIEKGKSFLKVNAHSSELKLAQVIGNRAAESSSTSKLFKKEFSGDEYTISTGQGNQTKKTKKTSKVPQFKIRILGEHDNSVANEALPWAYGPMSGSNPAWSVGRSYLPNGTWVYVYKDPVSGEHFIDRISPNTVCELKPKESGFQPGDTFFLVPDNMYKKGKGIPDCAEVFNNQVDSLADAKQYEISTEELTFSPWCTVKDGKGAGGAIQKELKDSKKISESLKESFKGLRDFKDSIDDAIENIEGDPNDKTDFWTALNNNEVTVVSFQNTIKAYRKNLANAAKWISDHLVKLFTKLKQQILRQSNVAANLLKGLFPNSARFITNEFWDLFSKAISCVWNAIIRLLPGLVDRALTAFFQKFVNTTNCLVENFIGGFLGQLLGQVAGLIQGVFDNVISALSKVAGVAGAILDVVDAIGNVLDNIMSILKCEFECFADEQNVIRYNILNGAKSASPIDFGAVFDKVKDVATAFEKVTNIPEDISTYDFRLDIDSLLEDMFDTTTCDSGPVFCDSPDVTFHGVKQIVETVGNAVISGEDGSIVGVDIVENGQVEDAASVPLIDIDDKCKNGHGGVGKVIIGPITGIGTVGVGTTGGITGIITDGTGGGAIGGQFGQGTTAGIGITYHVTVNAVAAGNRYFIDDKQQRTLTFDRGNTYILNQEHVSNNGHPLRFSETKDGTHGGGVEYTRGVTIDGIPGLGKSATDTAYSRIAVNNNTPDRLYYYCEIHPKMGGMINITGTTDVDTDVDGTTDVEGTTIIPTTTGQNATVEIETVNSNGGVVSVKNLKGGGGYNECMANVSTKGGNGTGFTIGIVKTDGGSITAISINDKGTNYQVGDIVIITARTTTTTTITPTTLTTFGVTKVLISNSGYGYLPAPDGSQGGDGRIWADRCQTVVRRKNLDWDDPYSPGDVITLYTGDWVQLPGKPKVYIDADFDASKLPGAQVTGVSTYVPKDMSEFPISSKTGKKSLNFQFTTATLIDSFKPSGLFDWQGDGPTGIKRTEGLSPDINSQLADWNFYLNGEYLGEFNQNTFEEVPQIIKDDISYRVGYLRSYTPPDPIDIAEEEFANQIPWVRAADVLPLNHWVLTDRQGWSSFLKNYGVYPATHDPQYKVIGKSSATWRVATFTPGTYTFEMQADNVGTLYWDGVQLGSTQPYAGHNRDLQFQFYAGDVEAAVHEIKAEISNIPHRGRVASEYNNITENPAAIAWILKDPFGAIIKTSLDEYGIPEVSDVFYDYDNYYSIMGYKIEDKDKDLSDEWFDCEVDYKKAKLLGFTDCDIRHFLENNPEIQLDSCMQSKIDNDNWGRCNGDLMVSVTAPGCPPPACIPKNTYPVVVCLDEIIIQNPGFNFDPCKDTVKIEPSNGAKAHIEESQDGEIRRIVVTDCGSGFTKLPEITINTETGYNAILLPIMKFHRPKHGGMTFPEGTPVIQVVDCVGKVV